MYFIFNYNRLGLKLKFIKCMIEDALSKKSVNLIGNIILITLFIGRQTFISKDELRTLGTQIKNFSSHNNFPYF